MTGPALMASAGARAYVCGTGDCAPSGVQAQVRGTSPPEAEDYFRKNQGCTPKKNWGQRNSVAFLLEVLHFLCFFC